MAFMSGVFCGIRSIEKVDWPDNAQWTEAIGKVRLLHLFGSSFGPRIKPSFATRMFAAFAGPTRLDGYVEWHRKGPIASLAFEPLYSAHPVGMMECDDWESGEKNMCTHCMNLKQNAEIGKGEAASYVPASNFRHLYMVLIWPETYCSSFLPTLGLFLYS
jgi:hypothetical protein